MKPAASTDAACTRSVVVPRGGWLFAAGLILGVVLLRFGFLAGGACVMWGLFALAAAPEKAWRARAQSERRESLDASFRCPGCGHEAAPPELGVHYRCGHREYVMRSERVRGRWMRVHTRYRLYVGEPAASLDAQATA